MSASAEQLNPDVDEPTPGEQLSDRGVETVGQARDLAVHLGSYALSSSTEINTSLTVMKGGELAVEEEPLIDALAILTPREREIHGLVSQGLSNRQIAQRCWVTEHTVKLHLSHIYGKLGVRNRTEAARIKAEDTPTKIIDEDVLTRTEWEILELVKEGLRSNEIAAKRGITAKTVKFHLSNIYTKTDTANRTEASLLTAASQATNTTSPSTEEQKDSSLA